ncbi:MAG TPA: hypothetical protein PLI21_04165 [Methanomassiliicoccaceae archaeon]|jgi:hypothetical protein|nr:hypothetical protein [Euryarchaeota archaeon]HOK28197.1 hypothetical protein [Methanomassiliicoccaceae archaeon]HOL06790.1 hypothetical protein [Methanomassiliicoccaceae archaeon]HPP44371.1 hypothetical protein [Methanomassiliicoccaceae archaeon]HPT73972.1 hypothetical protein [Methanomassiliicoccaceae archaeon]
MGSKLIGLALLSAGALSMVISVLSAAPGSSPALPGEAILHLAAIIGWSFAGAMLLSIGITLVLSTSTSE